MPADEEVGAHAGVAARTEARTWRVTEVSEGDARALRRSVMRFAWPAIAQMSFQTLAGVITQIVVGRLGPEAIAAIGLGNRFFFLAIGVLSALSAGTTTVVAHFVGGRDALRARRVIAQSLLLSAAVGLVLALLGYRYAEPAIDLLMTGHRDPAVVALGGTYLRWVAVSMILGMPMLVANAGLQGTGDMKTPMKLVLAMNILNVVFSLGFVFGIGPIPPLGFAGAVAGQAASRMVAGAAALAFLLLRPGPARLVASDFAWDASLLRRVLQVGVPAGLEQFMLQSSQMVYAVVIAGLGTAAIAANQVVLTVQSLSFMPGLGFSVAATTLVGQSLGACKPRLAERYGMETTVLGSVFMALMGVVFLIWADPLAQMFTSAPDVLEQTVPSLRIVALGQIPFAITMILNGALRGAGDTRWVMWATGLGQWGIRLLLTYVMALRWGWGIPGAWWAMVVDVAVRSFAVSWRYRTGRWKNVMAG